MANRYLFSLLLSCFTVITIPVFSKSESERNLFFTQNVGQFKDQFFVSRSDIHFKVEADNGLNIFIGNGAIHYQWTDRKSLAMQRLDVKLIGANPNSMITTDESTAGFQRYYLPSADDNAAVATTYKNVTYHNVYPNIDWVFYINSDGKLEHDFIVKEGGRVSDIKLEYGGAEMLSLESDGGLNAVTSMGSIHEAAPFSYEQVGEKKVSSSYVLEGNVLSFKMSPFNGTLIIDPVIDWGTYFGGVEYDDLREVKIVKDGYVYAVGSTNSTANIATTGAYQTSFSGGTNFAGSDAVLSKFSPSGNLIWSTYYGGNGNDIGKNIAFDTSGNIYLAGYTNSAAGIATAGSYQTLKMGSTSRTEAFLVKFDTSGQRMWGTYFGGTQYEANTAMSLCIDKNNHIYLAGNTNSASGIATSGAHQPSLAGSSDVFLAQFSTAGTLNWSTYYGGDGDELPYALACDTSGNVYVSGSTIGSPTGIATAGSFQSSYDAVTNGEDAFLAKFNSAGQLIWGTYYGDSGLDRVYASVVDQSGNIYIGGITSSTTGIATITVHQSLYGGGSEDGLIAKFSPSGSREWATYYGGNASDGIESLRLGSNNALYFTGYTTSSNAIAGNNAMQSSFGGVQDAFIGRINLSGDTTLWASYLGGIDDDNGFSLDAGDNGNVIVCGRTVSATGIATSGAYQSTFGGGDDDGFLIKIKDCNIPQIVGIIQGNTTVCSGSTHGYRVVSPTATSYYWFLQNGWTGLSQIDTIQITFNGNSGILKAVAVNDCFHSDTVSLNITLNALPPVPVIIRVGNSIKTTQVFAGYQWYLNGNAIAGATAQTCSLTATGIYTAVVFNAAGCSNTSASFDYTETGIDNMFVQNGISIYPNPVSDILHIQLRVAANTIIYDITGKVLQSNILPSGIAEIDMQKYATGLYLIKFSDLNGNMLGSCKVSKQ